MKKIIGISSIVISIIVLVTIGIKTRNSFVLNEEGNIKEYSFFEMVANQIYYDDVKNIDEFFKKTPIILKVKMGKKSERLNQCVLSEVIVEEVYKSNVQTTLNKGEKIYIYEPILIQHSDKSIYTANSYIPMINENEYIVFLKGLKVPEGYKMSNKEKVSFMYTDPMYGKRAAERKKYILKDKLKEIKVKDLDEYDVILKKEQIKEYNEYNEKIDKEINKRKNENK